MRYSGKISLLVIVGIAAVIAVMWTLKPRPSARPIASGASETLGVPVDNVRVRKHRFSEDVAITERFFHAADGTLLSMEETPSCRTCHADLNRVAIPVAENVSQLQKTIRGYYAAQAPSRCTSPAHTVVTVRNVALKYEDVEAKYSSYSDILTIELAFLEDPFWRSMAIQHELFHRCFSMPGHRIIEPWAYVAPLNYSSLKRMLTKDPETGRNRFIFYFLRHAAMLSRDGYNSRSDCFTSLASIQSEVTLLIGRLMPDDVERAATLWKDAFALYFEHSVFWDIVASTWIDPVIVQNVLLLQKLGIRTLAPVDTETTIMNEIVDASF